MKKLFLSLCLCLTTMVSMACWFTAADIRNNFLYIEQNGTANVNLLQIKNVNNLSSLYFNENFYVNLPLTVYCKVGQFGSNKEIIIAQLQYRKLPDGQWITIKRIENPNWDIKSNQPVLLFGRYSIMSNNLSYNDRIIVRLYLTDGVVQSGDKTATNDDFVQAVDRGDTINANTTFNGGWNAAYMAVLRVGRAFRPIR